MLAKQRDPEEGGTRIAIVFNGSPLFTGDADGGESNIRRWIIENDWLEAVVALPDHIGEITRIHGDFLHDNSRVFSVDGRDKRLTVSKVLDNADIGYQKITVERPLRLNFQASEARIARLDEQGGFRALVTPRKKGEDARRAEIEAGRGRQNALRDFCCILGDETEERLFLDRAEFHEAISAAVRATGLKLSLPERKLILAALGERDECAVVCRDVQGNPEPDPELRDTEIVPLTEAIQTYFEREVLPHVPDAWIDHEKTKIGYEIPLNRHFYRYEPPRPLPEIECDIKRLEQEILTLLSEVTA